MRHRFLSRTLLPTALAVLLVVPGSLVHTPAAHAADVTPAPARPCADLTVPEENHASIRLRVDRPAVDEKLAVDEHGKIAINGILHKHATMVDVSDEVVTATDFTIGPPPDGVAAWASSWSTSLRPPHLGANELCARAERDPQRSARIRRSFTVVDLIPPSNVPGLTVGTVTAYSAKVSWNAATDNYGLAGYEVTVDGGAPHRTVVGSRSYSITGLAPSSRHTVSVVAVDLAGNRSVTPATTSFTTLAAPQPQDPATGLTIVPEEGLAYVSWHPDPAGEARYVAYLDGKRFEEFLPDRHCVTAAGSPASPCTAQDMIRLAIGELDEATPYQVQIAALRADGTQSRMLSGTFTTPPASPIVPIETTQLIASEASRCAGLGGDFYASPSVRATVPVPAGSTQLFTGCYKVANTSCVDAFLPPSGNKVMKCVDDITRLLYAVAPPGRGPVISGMDGVPASPATLVPSPEKLVEPITWCVNDETCVMIIETAVETAEVAEIASAALAGTSILVVVGAGIGIGLVMGVLLSLVFQTPIGFTSFFEFPIDPDIDFDNFDKWGEDEGEWYNSAQVYAEVVKTTKQLTESENLPFTWDDAKSQLLKRQIDSACSAQHGTLASAGCDENTIVYVPGGTNRRYEPMLETGRHIVTALGDGGFPVPERAPWFYPARSKGGAAAAGKEYDHTWYNTVEKFKPNECDLNNNLTTCDEFPFFSTNQAVDLTGTRASLKLVPREEQDPQMWDIGGFYGKCRVKDGGNFIVLPVKPWVEAKGPSFAFKVEAGGTSLCMAPKRPEPKPN
jgi:hypothetical protein